MPTVLSPTFIPLSHFGRVALRQLIEVSLVSDDDVVRFRFDTSTTATSPTVVRINSRFDDDDGSLSSIDTSTTAKAAQYSSILC
jgi:hypothetical protein